MGLDMYLSKKTYVKNWKHDENRKHEVEVKLNGEPHPGIDPSKGFFPDQFPTEIITVHSIRSEESHQVFAICGRCGIGMG